MGYNGPAYTWCNNRFSSVPTYERLDHCLGNVEWCDAFPNTTVYNLPIILSDHASILTITQPSFIRWKTNFKFKNWWTFQEDYQEIAKNAWASSVNKPFHATTTNLAGNLKRWYKKKKPLQQQLENFQNQINEIQLKPLQMQDHSLQERLAAQYEENLTKLTEFYRQHAKKHWATQGDRNTSFFHNAVQKLKRQNRIVSIKDTHGNNLFDPDDIAKEFFFFAPPP
jgi:hypothetical protein